MSLMGYMAAGFASGAGKGIADAATLQMKANIEKNKLKYADELATGRLDKTIEANKDSASILASAKIATEDKSIGAAKDAAKLLASAKSNGYTFKSVKVKDEVGNETVKWFMVGQGGIKEVGAKDSPVAAGKMATVFRRLDGMSNSDRAPILQKMRQDSRFTADEIKSINDKYGTTIKDETDAGIIDAVKGYFNKTPEVKDTTAPTIKPLMVKPEPNTSATYGAGKAAGAGISKAAGAVGDTFNNTVVNTGESAINNYMKYVGKPFENLFNGFVDGVK